MSLRLARATKRVMGQPELQSESTASKQTNENEKTKTFITQTAKSKLRKPQKI